MIFFKKKSSCYPHADTYALDITGPHSVTKTTTTSSGAYEHWVELKIIFNFLVSSFVHGLY